MKHIWIQKNAFIFFAILFRCGHFNFNHQRCARALPSCANSSQGAAHTHYHSCVLYTVRCALVQSSCLLISIALHS